MVGWTEKSIKQKQMEISHVSKHIFTTHHEILTILDLFT
jgi:hypothetical protein